MKRIMIMAGGTGGHVFPALAVAKVLKEQGVFIFWMGTSRGIEARLVPESGYPLTTISVKGLRGNGALGWLMAPFKLLKAVYEAIRVLRVVRPEVVLGMGGFASGPGGVAAWLLRIPVVIHEQNAIPGLTNKILSHLAKQVLQGFPNSLAGARWVGNPVRKEIADLAEPKQRTNDNDAFNILVLGGSLGARALNTIVPQALAELDATKPIVVKHQCGDKHIADCKQNYHEAAIEAEVMPFIDDMAAAYQWADLVICRAGALTLAEVAAAGIASILVPYPYAVDDHQTYNAAALVEAGAAILIKERELSASLLAHNIGVLFDNRPRLLAMAMAAREHAKPEAAATIAEICTVVSHG